MQKVAHPPEIPGLTRRGTLKETKVPMQWFQPKENVTAVSKVFPLKDACSNRYTCPECSFTGKKHTVQGHINREHENKPPLECGTCNYTTYNRACMLEHEKYCIMSENTMPHSCPKCAFVSYKKWTITRHIRTHTTKKLFSCLICGQDYKHKQGLRRHEKSMHGDVM